MAFETDGQCFFCALFRQKMNSTSLNLYQIYSLGDFPVICFCFMSFSVSKFSHFVYFFQYSKWLTRKCTEKEWEMQSRECQNRSWGSSEKKLLSNWKSHSSLKMWVDLDRKILKYREKVKTNISNEPTRILRINSFLSIGFLRLLIDHGYHFISI